MTHPVPTQEATPRRRAHPLAQATLRAWLASAAHGPAARHRGKLRPRRVGAAVAIVAAAQALVVGADARAQGAPMTATVQAQAQAPSATPPAPASSVTRRPEPRFTIERFEVEGASMVTQAALQRALQPLVGPNKRFSDIEQALEAVRAVYDLAGITAMQVLIPQQTLRSGVVRLQVAELKVAAVEITGAQHRDAANIRRAVPALKEGATPSDLVISEQLRLANENPGRQMEVTFRTEDDGKLVGVVRAADRSPLAGQLSLDNTGNASTGRWRLSTALQHHNLFNRDVVGTLQVQTSPNYWQEVRVVSASARVPLYGAGWMLDFSGVNSSVDSGTVSTAAGNYQIASKGLNLSARATNLLPRLGGWDQRVWLGYDFKRVDSQITTATGGDSLVPDIELRPLSLGYQGQWRGEALTVFGLATFSRNLPAGGRSAPEVFDEAGLRLGANPRYRITRLTLSAAWPAWGGQASAAFSSQWTPDALVAAEQFGVGGDGSIRGFNGRVASSDQGERVGLEWQSPMRAWGAEAGKRAPGGAAQAPAALSTGWQTFLEAGQVRRNQPQPSEVRVTRLAAAGLGLRLLAWDRLSLRADLGVVLRGDGLARRGDRFVHAAAAMGF